MSYSCNDGYPKYIAKANRLLPEIVNYRPLTTDLISNIVT